MKKGKESAVANYMKSLPKGVKHIHTGPVMKDGKCVGAAVTYELNGVTICKELPNDDPSSV